MFMSTRNSSRRGADWPGPLGLRESTASWAECLPLGFVSTSAPRPGHEHLQPGDSCGLPDGLLAPSPLPVVGSPWSSQRDRSERGAPLWKTFQLLPDELGVKSREEWPTPFSTSLPAALSPALLTPAFPGSSDTPSPARPVLPGGGHRTCSPSPEDGPCPTSSHSGPGSDVVSPNGRPGRQSNA